MKPFNYFCDESILILIALIKIKNYMDDNILLIFKWKKLLQNHIKNYEKILDFTSCLFCLFAFATKFLLLKIIRGSHERLHIVFSYNRYEEEEKSESRF